MKNEEADSKELKDQKQDQAFEAEDFQEKPRLAELAERMAWPSTQDPIGF